MTLSKVYLKWRYNISMSKCLITRLTEFGILYLKIWVFIIWILSQRLEVANRIVLPDLSWKVVDQVLFINRKQLKKVLTRDQDNNVCMFFRVG